MRPDTAVTGRCHFEQVKTQTLPLTDRVEFFVFVFESTLRALSVPLITRLPFLQSVQKRLLPPEQSRLVPALRLAQPKKERGCLQVAWKEGHLYRVPATYSR